MPKPRPYTFSVENVTVTGSTVASEPNPVANNDSYSVVTANMTLAIGAPGVLANDTDADGDKLDGGIGEHDDTTNAEPEHQRRFYVTHQPRLTSTVQDGFTYQANDGARRIQAWRR